MQPTRKHRDPAVITNALVLVGFLGFSGLGQRWDFILYMSLIAFVFFVILWTDKKYHYSPMVWWGLAVWTLSHLSGGAFFIGDNRLYETVLIPLVGEPYLILKYDQVLHIMGSIVITSTLIDILKKTLHVENWHKTSFLLTVALAGLGIGAFYEILEFVVTVLTPRHFIGGYENNAIDLVCDVIGSGIAVLIASKRRLQPA